MEKDRKRRQGGGKIKEKNRKRRQGRRKIKGKGWKEKTRKGGK